MSAAAYFAEVQATPGWARVLASFLRFLAPAPGWRVLDLGCGPGALVQQFAEAGCRAAGMDADPAMLAEARRRRPGLDFIRGDLRALPFPAGAADAVTATNVLFLLDDPLTGLREMARLCRPGGRVAVLNPSPRMSAAAAEAHADANELTGLARESFINWGRQADRHHRWDAAGLRRLFQQAGLSEPAIAEKIGPGLALFAQAGPR